MKRLVIGLVGRKGSGKGTVAKTLKEKYGASVYRYSDILRDLLDVLAIQKSRENLIQISEDVRRGFGEEVIKRALLKRMENDTADCVVLDGLRRLGDLEGLEQLGHFTLVSVEAPLEIRFERIRQRGENVGETTRTLESFREMENAPTEITIADIETRATITIENGGDRKNMEANVEEIMNRLKQMK